MIICKDWHDSTSGLGTRLAPDWFEFYPWLHLWSQTLPAVIPKYSQEFAQRVIPKHYQWLKNKQIDFYNMAVKSGELGTKWEKIQLKILKSVFIKGNEQR